MGEHGERLGDGRGNSTGRTRPRHFLRHFPKRIFRMVLWIRKKIACANSIEPAGVAKSGAVGGSEICRQDRKRR